MRKILRLMVAGAAGFISLLFLSGCLSTNPGSSSMAFIDLDTGTVATIRAEMIRVFEDDNYTLIRDADGEMVFEREATERDRVLYGRFGDEQLAMRIVASIEPRRKGGYLVRADAYAIHDRRTEKLSSLARRPFQALLNRVKASLVTSN